MTCEEARVLVERYLERHAAPSDCDTVILDSATLERSWGWVIFYQSRAFVESGDLSDALAGNAPLIVERGSGRLLETGTAEPIESYLHNFEVTGDPHGKPGRRLEVHPARAGADRIGGARLLDCHCSVGVGVTKRDLDGVVRGEAFRIEAPSADAAREVCDSLSALGFEARQLSEAGD
jgi:hypothetical protein